MPVILASCPDTFTVCGPPQHGLGQLLIAIPIAGALLAAVGFVFTLPRLRPTSHAWAVPLVIVAFGAFVGAAVHDRIVPPGPVVYYDEYLHAETTANLAQRGSPAPCCAYANGECVAGGPIQWPLSTHLASAAIQSVSYAQGVTGGMRHRQQFNRFAYLIAPTLVLIWVLLTGAELFPATIVSLAFALWPGFLRLISTADLAPGALLFVLLALIAVELERKRPGWAGTLATVGTFALAAHSRLELALILPWILWRSPRRWAVALSSVFVIAPLVWLYVEGKATTIGWTPDLAAQLRRHLPIDVAFLFSTKGALPAISLLALLGLTRHELRPLFATAALLLVFIASYTFGEFRTDADGFRYALPIIVLLLPLAAAGLAMVLRRASARRPLVGALLAIAVIGPVAFQLPLLRSENPVAELDEMIRGSPLQRLNPDTVVTRSVAYARAITHAPNVVERCTEGGFDHLFETEPYYLRTWGDVGPEPYSYGCSTWIPGTVSPSPDGQGPWLYFWDLSCHQD